jgi:hypothetical protein
MPLHPTSHDPEPATPSGLTLARFRLFPFRSPLLGESRLLSFPRGTEMFQFPRFPLPVLCVQTGVTPHYGCWVSPFGYPRINAWSATPRGFSQPPTSFIGFRRQGIHRWLFVAWKIKDARARYGVLKERPGATAPLPVNGTGTVHRSSQSPMAGTFRANSNGRPASR